MCTAVGSVLKKTKQQKVKNSFFLQNKARQYHTANRNRCDAHEDNHHQQPTLHLIHKKNHSPPITRLQCGPTTRKKKRLRIIASNMSASSNLAGYCDTPSLNALKRIDCVLPGTCQVTGIWYLVEFSVVALASLSTISSSNFLSASKKSVRHDEYRLYTAWSDLKSDEIQYRSGSSRSSDQCAARVSYVLSFFVFVFIFITIIVVLLFCSGHPTINA